MSCDDLCHTSIHNEAVAFRVGVGYYVIAKKRHRDWGGHLLQWWI